MQTIYIEREDNIFYCPFCGIATLRQEAEEDMFNLCEHLLFIAVDADEPFVYCIKKIEEFYSQLEEEMLEKDKGLNIWEFLCEDHIDKLEIPNSFIFIKHSGGHLAPLNAYLGFRYKE